MRISCSRCCVACMQHCQIRAVQQPKHPCIILLQQPRIFCAYCWCCWHCCCTLQKLHAVKGLSEAKADKMLEAARKLTTAGSWMTGAEAMQKVCSILYLHGSLYLHHAAGTYCTSRCTSRYAHQLSCSQGVMKLLFCGLQLCM